jgi:hypothetical protein
MNSHADLLAEVRTLAGQQRWTTVTDYLTTLDAAPAGSVLALPGPGLDAGTLLAALPRIPVTVRPLLTASAEPGRTLEADRVLIIFRCGQLLSLEEAEAARTVLLRPAGTTYVVFAEADRLGSTEELELVERAAWRVLLAGPHEDWAGQDLASRHCVLWSGRPEQSPFSGRLARDAALLDDWLTGPLDTAPLDLARCAQALDLAEAALSTATIAAPANADSASARHRAGRLRSAVRDAGERIDERLEGSAQTVTRELAASLDTVREDLRAGVADHLQRHCRDLSRPAEISDCLARYLQTGMQRWESGSYALTLGKARQALADSETALDDVDWRAVDKLLPPRAGGGSYRDALADAVRRDGVTRSVYRADGRTAFTMPGRPRRTAPVPLAFAGGAVGLTASLLLGAPVILHVVASAAGAMGGHLIEQRRADGGVSDAVVEGARRVIGVQVDAYRTGTGNELAAFFADRRAAAAAATADLERALAAATSAPAGAGDSGAGPKDQLGDLRRRLVDAC